MYLKTTIISQQSICSIPECPPVNLPSRKYLPVLDTLAPDIIELDNIKKSNEIGEMTCRKRVELRQDDKMQDCNAPLVNEVLFEEWLQTEPNWSQKIASKEKQLVLENYNVDIEGVEKEYLKDGSQPAT